MSLAKIVMFISMNGYIGPGSDSIEPESGKCGSMLFRLMRLNEVDVCFLLAVRPVPVQPPVPLIGTIRLRIGRAMRRALRSDAPAASSALDVSFRQDQVRFFLLVVVFVIHGVIPRFSLTSGDRRRRRRSKASTECSFGKPSTGSPSRGLPNGYRCRI